MAALDHDPGRDWSDRDRRLALDRKRQRWGWDGCVHRCGHDLSSTGSDRERTQGSAKPSCRDADLLFCVTDVACCGWGDVGLALTMVTGELYRQASLKTLPYL